jgi:DNA-binding LacI/PurR family transcriptional regulator
MLPAVRRPGELADKPPHFRGETVAEREPGWRPFAGAPRGDSRPTSVFCTSARMTVGVLRALHERGLRVPRDVSVAGFGVLDASALPYPALTLAEGDKRQLVAWPSTA